jgi:hypothetical protein
MCVRCQANGFGTRADENKSAAFDLIGKIGVF